MGEDYDRFEPLFEHANDAIALVEFEDETPVIDDANPAFRGLFAPCGADILGRDLDEIVASGERTEQAREISRQARNGRVVSRELTRDTVDGPRDFHWQLVPVENPDADAIERAFAIYTDITERTRERERFQAFIERSMDIITVLDASGTFQYQSPSSERIVGYEPTELIGENAFEYVHPDDRQALMETFYEGIENPARNPTMEYRFRHKDGSWLWLESRGNYQLDNPAIEGFVINSRNITERKQHERELEDVHERMEFALKSTDAMVWNWNVDEDRATFYPSEEGLYGTSVDSWDDFFELIHPEDRQKVPESMEEVLETGEPKHEDLRIIRDGEVRWIEAPGQSVQDPDGTTRMVGVARDVTERVERERKIEESEERYRRLLATAPTPIFIYSDGGELIYANDAAVAFLGADDTEEILGLTASDFTHPDNKVDVERRGRQLLEERETVPAIEEKLIDLNGEVKHAILAAAPIRYEGEPAIQTVATDITEVKRREEELERQNERLDEFVSIASHDMRNPLNVAQGRLELARQDCDSDQLDALQRSLNRMETLIEDLLDLARHGEEVREVESVNLADVVDTCWRTVATQDATLSVEAVAEIPADESRLRQLFENLIRNAVEHAGSDVTVRVGTLEKGFFVEDDGPGIPPERREQVFESGHSMSHSGGGFGLAIVKQIVEAHGWTIRVVEGASGGARFEVTDIGSTNGES